MKIIKQLIIAGAFITLAGCSTFNTGGGVNDYYTSQEPTKESILSSSEQRQIYKSTLYLPTDFKEDGSLKSLQDFNFANESSPCTILSDFKISPTHKQKFYTINAQRGYKKSEFMFECRPHQSYANQDEKRLFLVGSLLECSSRTWDYASSSFHFYRQLAKGCALGLETKNTKKIELLYNEIILGK